MDAIEFAAQTLRPKADARNGRGGLFAADRETAAQLRAFVRFADELRAWRDAR